MKYLGQGEAFHAYDQNNLGIRFMSRILAVKEASDPFKYRDVSKGRGRAEYIPGSL